MDNGYVSQTHESYYNDTIKSWTFIYKVIYINNTVIERSIFKI